MKGLGTSPWSRGSTAAADEKNRCKILQTSDLPLLFFFCDPAEKKTRKKEELNREKTHGLLVKKKEIWTRNINRSVWDPVTRRRIGFVILNGRKPIFPCVRCFYFHEVQISWFCRSNRTVRGFRKNALFSNLKAFEILRKAKEEETAGRAKRDKPCSRCQKTKCSEMSGKIM